MNTVSNALWICTAALVVTAVSLTAFGLRQQPSRGWRWWVGALWLASLGAAAAALGKSAQVPVQWPAALLLTQWPVLTLIGLRRFHARARLPLNEAADWSVLVAAAAVAVAASLASGDSALAAWLSAASAVLVHLYVACLLFSGPSGRDAVPLLWLSVTITLVALLPLPVSWPGYELLPPIELRTTAATLGCVVMAFVVLTLASERTEHQLRDSHRRLRVLANMDPLTQVPNRRHFHELATLALRSDPGGSATLLMFDIDHFKHINDQLGHAAGDRALRLVSTSMVEHLRAHDVAGRHGGDEFALLLRQTQVAHAGLVAARIVADLQSQAQASVLPRLSLSFGMVQVLGGEGIDDALRRADQALYEAKRQGRSRAVTAEGDEDEPVFSESQRLGLTVS